MNVNKMKTGFVQYLEELRKKEPNGKYENIDYANVNIFSYQNEFKDFVSDEYNTTNSIQSMSINDILKMEVDETGKLVTEEELKAMEQATEDAENGIMPEDSESEEQPVNLVTGIVNEMSQNEDFIKAFDADGSSDINDEELDNFLKLANNIDGDTENLTVDDLMGSMEAIANGEDLSKLDPNNAENKAEEDKDETNIGEEIGEGLTDVLDATTGAIEGLTGTATDLASQAGDMLTQGTDALQGTQETEGNQQVQGQQQNGNNTGVANGSLGKTGNNENNQAAKNGKDLENLSLDELKTEKTKADSDLSKEQDELAKIKDGTNTELKSLKEDEEKAYEEYQEKLKEVDEELAQQVDDLKNQIADKDQQIGQKQNEITQKESEKAEAQTAVTNAETKIAALNGKKATLTAQLAVATPEQKPIIQAQIVEVEAEIKAAEAEKKAAEERLAQAEADLSRLQGELGTLQSEKADLESQMQQKETEIAQKHPEVNQSMQDYKEAQRAYDAKEKELTTEAQKGVDEAQKYVNDIAKEISERETDELLKQWPTDEYNAEAGQELANAAKNSKWGQTTQGQKRCATGVADIFNSVYGTDYHGNGCDWDTNMDDMVEKGYFKEVTSDYPSAQDLSNLPAGAVVCWEATTGEGNGGARYGHVAIADGEGGEISDHYSENIYTEIGGRSDNYKVYIPIK